MCDIAEKSHEIIAGWIFINNILHLRFEASANINKKDSLCESVLSFNVIFVDGMARVRTVFHIFKYIPRFETRFLA